MEVPVENAGRVNCVLLALRKFVLLRLLEWCAMMKDPKSRLTIFFPGDLKEKERGWEPRADIYRASNGWVVKLDLAGIRPEDVTLKIAGPTLHVQGIRRDWIIEEDWSHHSMEITYSQFERSLQLPCEIQDAQIKMDYRDGMLIVRLICDVEWP